jgi:hypothetical protein
MKIRILCLACAASFAALSAGCAVYENSDACQQMMRSKLAETSSDKLSIDHTGAGIHGSRVVVEGTIVHLESASEVAAASASAAASAPAAGSAAIAASAPVAASAGAARVASTKPKQTKKAAAAECTFDQNKLTAFKWLAPAEFVKEAAGNSHTE